MNAYRFNYAILLTLLTSSAGCCHHPVDPAAPTGQPAFLYTAARSGCSNFFVYTENAARTEVLVVEGNTDALGLTTTPRTFLIEENAGKLGVHVDLFTDTVGERYCTDIGGQVAPQKWNAVRGRLEISVSAVNVPINQLYQVTIRLHDVEFRSPQGDRSATLPQLVLENVTVGWLPG